MVTPESLPSLDIGEKTGYRLVNSKFPPVSLFDDVASADEFEVAYALQALVNPRIQTEIGNLSLLRRDEIPYGIVGCSYATAPFTHVNPEGSRFSDGTYGMLYIGDTVETAIAEVSHHQRAYWGDVHGLKFERFVFRELVVDFDGVAVRDASDLSEEDSVYDPRDYTASRALGIALRQGEAIGLQYRSVRHRGAKCWGFFTPKYVKRILQTAHYEMIWSGKDSPIEVCRLKSA